MAVCLWSNEVSDLCIGKPHLRSLPAKATVSDALKRCGESCLSVWISDPSLSSSRETKACVSKICMVDVICYLCSDENIRDPAAALGSPVSVLLRCKGSGLVRSVEPHCSVMEALDVILDGAQNLVVPIKPNEYCWLSQEDFVRYFFNSIAHFSSVAALSVAHLGLVRRDLILAVGYHEPALSALPLLRRAAEEQTSVAVVAEDGKLIGEISPSTLSACDESVAAAFGALSAGDLMAYIDCYGSAPEAAVVAIRERLLEKGLEGLADLIDGEVEAEVEVEVEFEAETVVERRRRRGVRKQRSGSYSAWMGRTSEEAIVCHPGSSLVAVMVQAMVHRVSYVWVVDEEEYELVGVVAFSDVLRVFSELL